MSELGSFLWGAISDPTWRVWLGCALCALGGISTIIAGVGVLRFPDFYTRMHAASVTDTLGAFALLFGMALLAPEYDGNWVIVVFKLFMIGLFLTLTGPTSTHAIANAAFTAGLHPLVGRIDELHQADSEEEEG